MKKVLGLILITIFMLTNFLLGSISHGQEQEEANTVIGEIIEIVPDERIIQVGNRNYIVETVYLDDGSAGEPVLGRFGNLDLGSIVEIYTGESNEGFWEAKKVVLFLGVKKEEILELIEE
jgi:hypothetical protein